MKKEWSPPFCAKLVEDEKCPVCGVCDVYVHEKETYYDANDYPAYCGECHAELVVYACVEVTFGDAEVVINDGATREKHPHAPCDRGNGNPCEWCQKVVFVSGGR